MTAMIQVVEQNTIGNDFQHTAVEARQVIPKEWSKFRVDEPNASRVEPCPQNLLKIHDR